MIHSTETSTENMGLLLITGTYGSNKLVKQEEVMLQEVKIPSDADGEKHKREKRAIICFEQEQKSSSKMAKCLTIPQSDTMCFEHLFGVVNMIRISVGVNCQTPNKFRGQQPINILLVLMQRKRK